jgi:peptide/nickel transport system ATP-binding protein
VLFEGREISAHDEPELRTVRLRLQMIFQDSQSALNPRHRIVDSLGAPFIAHGLANRQDARRRAHSLLERVGLTTQHGERFPHELSGGQRQRVGIARALALEPTFIVADEIVSGLDVSVQAQILALLRQLRTDSGVGIIFISHDLSVVRTLCDRVAVMQHGRIVETRDCASVFTRPQHDYTRTLLRAIPLPVVEPGWLSDVGEHAGRW